jgi:hypothetical protein
LPFPLKREVQVNASNRIVALLNKNMPNDDEAVSFKRNNGVEGFDIGEFV